MSHQERVSVSQLREFMGWVQQGEVGGWISAITSRLQESLLVPVARAVNAVFDQLSQAWQGGGSGIEHQRLDLQLVRRLWHEVVRAVDGRLDSRSLLARSRAPLTPVDHQLLALLEYSSALSYGKVRPDGESRGMMLVQGMLAWGIGVSERTIKRSLVRLRRAGMLWFRGHSEAHDEQLRRYDSTLLVLGDIQLGQLEVESCDGHRDFMRDLGQGGSVPGRVRLLLSSLAFVGAGGFIDRFMTATLVAIYSRSSKSFWAACARVEAAFEGSVELPVASECGDGVTAQFTRPATYPPEFIHGASGCAGLSPEQSGQLDVPDGCCLSPVDRRLDVVSSCADAPCWGDQAPCYRSSQSAGETGDALASDGVFRRAAYP